MTSFPLRIEAAIARVDALEDAAARAAAYDALTAILDLHGEGLRRTLSVLRQTSDGSDAVLEALANDEMVASLLLCHGLHPQSADARVRAALRRIVIGSQDQIELVSVDAATVRVRVVGTERLRREVATALANAVPDVEHLDVVLADRGLVPIERLTAKVTRETAHERCDLCGQALSSDHDHLFDIDTRKLRCSCTACALLFDSPTAKTRRVRKDVVWLEHFRLSDASWRALGVPVSLAFFSYSSTRSELIASYPGPGGAMEALVPRPAWEALAFENPVLAEMAPDTTALLVDRLSTPPRYHLVSIDECFRLTGIVRSRWQGITGGTGPIEALEEFFGGLSEDRS